MLRHTLCFFNQLYAQLAILFFLLSASQTSLAANTEISGTLETEIGRDTDFNNVNSSSINQATVEINLNSQISPTVSTNITLLYEDNGDNPLNVDAAFVRISKEKIPWRIQFGLQYLPFGWFETYMVSDPLTLELAETSESAFLLAYENNIYARVYVANGDINKVDSEVTVGHYGVSFGFKSDVEANTGIDVGFDYTNNIGDSNNAGDLITQDPFLSGGIGSNGSMEKFIPGAAGHLGIKIHSLHLVTELIYATDKFQSPEIRLNDAKPSAANAEIALEFGNDNIIAVGVQRSVDMEGFGLPASRTLATLSSNFSNGIGVALEIRNDKDYTDTGTGNSGHGFTMQFSAAF